MNFFTSDFKVCSMIFLHLFTYQLIYRSLFVSYIAHIMCICIHICERYYFPLLLFLKQKWKDFPHDLINLFNIIILFNKFPLITSYEFANSYLFLFLKCFYSRELDHIKPMFLSYRKNLFYLHDKPTDSGFCMMVKLVANA